MKRQKKPTHIFKVVQEWVRQNPHLNISPTLPFKVLGSAKVKSTKAALGN